ncbi:hypothetical protein GWK47_042771 [Chionoecetes opilio]|uniref:Uncharacterized protein n=1 Tax=Chionoecetes opilio TaxID=41210 RepID=A0A8J5CWI9_CHIOP|nr:hypothetical protein GWK47_042771 [Chionoecetes opilio]
MEKARWLPLILPRPGRVTCSSCSRYPVTVSPSPPGEIAAGSLRGVIESADPGHAPRSPSTSGVFAGVSAFLRTHSLERVRKSCDVEYGLGFRGSLPGPLRRGRSLCCPVTSLRRGWVWTAGLTLDVSRLILVSILVVSFLSVSCSFAPRVGRGFLPVSKVAVS